MMPKQSSETPLPQPGRNDQAAHRTMSKRFREHTPIEIANRDRLQASEKIWASVAHALKAVGAQQGWNHRKHGDLIDIARHAATVMADQSSASRRTRQNRINRFMDRFNAVEAMHANFYENQRDWDEIEQAQTAAEYLLTQLETFQNNPPATFTLRSDSEQRRLARLLGITQEERELDRLLPRDRQLPIDRSINDPDRPGRTPPC